MTLVLDRLMVQSYIKSYIICLVSLLGLYIVVDLFMNVNDFTQVTGQKGLSAFLVHIGRYYAAKSTTMFDKLSEMIVLLAAMFTIAWVQRNNELLPQLSAGVSTHRVVRPVLFAACAMITMATLNQELLIPQLSEMLSLNRDDPQGERPLAVRQGYEPNGIFISGMAGTRKTLTVSNFHCNIKEPIAPGNINLYAKEARYIPPTAEGESRTGGWLLSGTTAPPDLEKDLGDGPDKKNAELRKVLEHVSPNKYFLKTTEVDFDVLTRNQQKWFYWASTWRIFQELGKADVERAAAPMAVLFHMRLTRPILGMILVFLGLSVILRDQNRNVFISAALCLMICAVFFATCFGCKELGDKELVSPPLAAWMPVMIFGPLSFVMFDAIHT